MYVYIFQAKLERGQTKLIQLIDNHLKYVKYFVTLRQLLYCNNFKYFQDFKKSN